MTDDIEIDISTLETGCWVDGHWGIYSYSRIITIAEDFGYTPSTEYLEGNREPATEEEIEESEDAIAWLNANACADDHLWGWEDGEFYYLHLDTWEEQIYYGPFDGD
jgi:hypothetical protein